MKITTLYLLDSKIKWKTFKMLQDKLVKDSGPTPANADKMVWQMLRDKKIYCWFSEEMKNDMGVGTELPEHKILKIIR